jgi:hypothetical protein
MCTRELCASEVELLVALKQLNVHDMYHSLSKGSDADMLARGVPVCRETLQQTISSIAVLAIVPSVRARMDVFEYS